MRKKMRKKIICFSLTIILLSGTTGCNIFSFLHTTPAGTEGYIAEGKGFLNSGDYDQAVTSFAAAMAEDPNNSDARYYHAIAVARANGISVAEMGIEFFQSLNSGSVDGADMFQGFDPQKLENMYLATTEITTDLFPIVFETTTSGETTKNDISLSYIMNLTMSAMLFIAKIQAAFSDLGFSIDENGNLQFTGLNSIDSVNDLVDTSFNLLDDAVDGYSAISGDVEGTTKLKDKTTAIRDSINKYKVEKDVDNDGDGLIDEEWLNGLDDDGDKLIDEDSTGRNGPWL
jgi:hypothetical protein